ncbi:interferon-induced protein with tetratricopeptide repeats 1B-like isoform X2 [Dipodomys spectabilis]|uniref:interferon-induced protein with tetratricopeptide repeats 1B-like isoform X2 n=1 Tax=Dipodomys spectabilis TaxID=105255 RepID=UPI001C542162|nr:interferon-induced protein with tetratricopeptide repeats 1B-like isoform X2 [Dipodomys spectabilis]
MSQEHHRTMIEENCNQLRCHFTWGLVVEDSAVPDLDNRIWEEIEFLDTKYNVGIYNLLAYVKHLQGQDEDALQSLNKAEDLIHREHADLSDIGSLVTWGNYAWLYYHMGRLEEAQTYLDKVEDTCRKFASQFRYSMECPEMDCAEGWALLKCGRQNYVRARACFEKALQVEPENPEFSTGYAITLYRLDSDHNDVISLNPLRQAVRLNPADTYIKVLLALKLQDVKQEDEGEMYIKEALGSTTSLMYILRYAAKFYRRKGCVERALELLQRALQETPSSVFLHHQIGLCYRAQMLQIKNQTSRGSRGQNRENINSLVQLAIHKFQTTLALKPTYELAYVDLAEMHAEIGQYREAEDNFQRALNMNNCAEHMQQEIHLRYGHFQRFHQNSEDKAITHYLKGLKIKEISCARGRLLKALKQLAEKHLHQNIQIVESLSLLGLVHKLQGDINKALQCYEEALKHTTFLNPDF